MSSSTPDHGQFIALGDVNASLKVYIDKRPPIEPYISLLESLPVTPGEIEAIGTQCGNGWRKVFNLYAKLAHGVFNIETSWQIYREACLLQKAQNTALVFTPFAGGETSSINIVMGKGYAQQLGLVNLTVFDADFSYCQKQRVITTPYFDYRQLTNEKLGRLLHIIRYYFLSKP